MQSTVIDCLVDGRLRNASCPLGRGTSAYGGAISGGCCGLTIAGIVGHVAALGICPQRPKDVPPNADNAFTSSAFANCHS